MKMGGVSRASHESFRSVINVDGKKCYLYTGKDFFEACCARKSAEAKIEKGLPVRPNKKRVSLKDRLLQFLKENPAGEGLENICTVFNVDKNTANGCLSGLKENGKARNEPYDPEMDYISAPRRWFAIENKAAITRSEVLKMPFVPSQIA